LAELRREALGDGDRAEIADAREMELRRLSVAELRSFTGDSDLEAPPRFAISPSTLCSEETEEARDARFFGSGGESSFFSTASKRSRSELFADTGVVSDRARLAESVADSFEAALMPLESFEAALRPLALGGDDCPGG